MRAAVVVPTNRPQRMRDFCAAWVKQFNCPDVRLIICEDGPEKSPDFPHWAEHYCWADIDVQLGEKASCIPRRSGGVRSFGFWLAGQDESVDMVVSLDDDVLPATNKGHPFLVAHWAMLDYPVGLRWFNTLKDDELYPRGYPYSQQHPHGSKPVLNHGMWLGVPDIDAHTQLRWCPTIEEETHDSDVIPPGMFFSCCGMNYAFRREVAPFCFFPPLPDGMKRWDDIWSGIIFKRIADLHGWAVTSGYPCVRHERASDPLNNLRQEMLGYGLNERLWQVVDAVSRGDEPLTTYRMIADRLMLAFPELRETGKAMHMWASLWR